MVDAVDQAAPAESNFEDAFAALANLDQSALDDGETTPPKKPEEAPAPAADAQPAETGADETPPAETPPADAPPAETPAPKDTAPSSTVLDRLEQLLKEAPPTAAPAAAPASAPQEAPALFTSEEVEYLQNYEKDWPDVARANALIRRAENQQVIQYVFNELAKEIRPLMETVQVLAQRTQLSDLTARVPDYDTTRDQVIDWVATQPAYLQDAYNRVIEHGTVDEVADLIGRYKRETGAPAATAAVPAPTPKKPDTELPPATKQAAAALAPVSSKRTVIPQAVDPTDFEAAFSAFASKM